MGVLHHLHAVQGQVDADARLVEDEPDTTEAAHLSACAECRTQLDAMTEDVHALAMLPDMAVVPDQWEALERRLTDEGLIHRPQHRARGGLDRGLLRDGAAPGCSLEPDSFRTGRGPRGREDARGRGLQGEEGTRLDLSQRHGGVVDRPG